MIAATYSETFPTFLDAANAMMPDLGVSDVNMGGRIIPRPAVSSPQSAAELIEAIQFIAEGGNLLLGVVFDLSRFAKTAPPNAVLPTWRNCIFDAVLGNTLNLTSIEVNVVDQKHLVGVFDARLEALTPGAAHT